MTSTRAMTVMAVAALLVVPTVGCKKSSEGGRAAKRTVKASIAEFDPNADVVLDLNAYGTERADEWLVQEAFNQSFEGLDRCIAEHKARIGMSEEQTLEGGVSVAVKLDPKKGRPSAVNASFSAKSLEKKDHRALKDCVREVVATVDFPTYDGPPQVAEFEVDPLDPGYAWED